MTTSWVAGTVRAKALARRRLGAAGARELAARPDLGEALAVLVSTPYGHDVRLDHTLAEAQHDVGATVLWHLRVLAGWLPREGVNALHLLAGGHEIANADEHLSRLGGTPAEPDYRMGLLDTAWTRLGATSSITEVRDVLASSPWGDPGAATPWSIHVGMRLAWADRVASAIPEAGGWATSAAALLVLREAVLGARSLPEPIARRASYVLGPPFVATVTASPPPTIPSLVEQLPSDARWVLAGIDRPDELWRAEVAWWHRVERDGFALLRQAGFGRAPVIGAVAVLAADAWRVRAALEVAARGSVEAFDAVA